MSEEPIFVRPVGEGPESPPPRLPTHVLSISTKVELADDVIMGPTEVSQFADSIVGLWRHSGKIKNRPDQPARYVSLPETQVMAIMSLIGELASVYSGTRLQQVANEVLRSLVQKQRQISE